MVNWHDPTQELWCGRAVVFILDVCVGWYCWDFLSSLRFDWDCIRRRPFRWTLIPYFLARYCALISVILGARVVILLQPMSAASCTSLWRWTLGIALMAVVWASFLLVIRVVAICEHNPWVKLFFGSFWLAEIGTALHGTATIDAVYVPELFTCAITHSDRLRVNVLISFSLNFCCLAVLFLCLLRTPSKGIWTVLVSQGVVYLGVVILAYVPPSVLLLLNLNDAMNMLMQPPTLTSLVICATRIFRGLVRLGNEPDGDTIVMTTTNMGWRTARSQAPGVNSVGDEESQYRSALAASSHAADSKGPFIVSDEV